MCARFIPRKKKLSLSSGSRIRGESDNGHRRWAMDEVIKCAGCGSECERTFEDVMGNDRCNVCLPDLDDDEYLDDAFITPEY